MSTKSLPEFQEFLRARKIVLDRKVTFYAHWVSEIPRFLKPERGCERGFAGIKVLIKD